MSISYAKDALDPKTFYFARRSIFYRGREYELSAKALETLVTLLNAEGRWRTAAECATSYGLWAVNLTKIRNFIRLADLPIKLHSKQRHGVMLEIIRNTDDNKTSRAS